MMHTKLEYCDAVWNPVSGCVGSCSYCYARKQIRRFQGDVRRNLLRKGEYKRLSADGHDLYHLESPMKSDDTGKQMHYPFGFAPTFHEYKLDDMARLRSSKVIMVGNMTDLFAPQIPQEWREKVFDSCRKYPEHTYLFQTRYPESYAGDIPLTPYFWYGTTVTSQNDISRITALPHREGMNKYVCFEPLKGQIDFTRLLEENKKSLQEIRWFIIGGERGRYSSRKEVPYSWIEPILEAADQLHIPVFMRNDLIPSVGLENMRREQPENFNQKIISDRKKDLLYSHCFGCKLFLPKREMVTIIARKGRNGRTRSMGYLCERCFKKFCNDNLNTDVPKEFRRNE